MLQLDTGRDKLFQQLGDMIRAGMEQYQVPGVAVGLIAGERTYTAALGTRSLENPLPVETQTIFRVSSITKTVTATAIMRLVEQGALDLDAPIRTVLPTLRLADESVAARVTLRHVLTHTGGWVGDYWEDTGDGDDALARIVDKLALQTQVTPLGEVFSYSNSGFYLAGRVIEAATGQPYETAVRKLVLAPLGMHDAFFFPHDVMTRNFALGHVVRDDGVVTARPWALARSANPVGGLACSVHDLLTYARFHLGDGRAPDGTRLLAPETLVRMQTPAVRTGDETWMGLPWRIRDVGGVRFVGHGGFSRGQQAEFWFAPGRNVALVVLTNADRGGHLGDEVTDWVREHALGAVLTPVRPLKATAAELGEYAGRYVLIGPGDVIDITPADRAFEVRLIDGDDGSGGVPSEPIPPLGAALYARDRLIITSGRLKGSKYEFLRDADGRVAWLRAASRVHTRQ